jgi:predicted ArsR family transcriptional regulator
MPGDGATRVPQSASTDRRRNGLGWRNDGGEAVTEGLGDEVRALLLRSIDSIAELETLLLLHRDPAGAWDAARVAAELRVEPRSAEEQLAGLAERGLLSAEGSGSGRSWRYGPATRELARAVDALAAAYDERRVSVVEFLYSKPAVDKLRVFADAFRLREDDSDG